MVDNTWITWKHGQHKNRYAQNRKYGYLLFYFGAFKWVTEKQVGWSALIQRDLCNGWFGYITTTNIYKKGKYVMPKGRMVAGRCHDSSLQLHPMPTSIVIFILIISSGTGFMPKLNSSKAEAHSWKISRCKVTNVP